MDGDRWRRISELYHGARDLAPHERAAFLESACGGDDPLRREIASLLANDASADAFLARPANEVVIDLIESGSDPLPGTLPPGTMVGNYRIERELGRGGMGAVFLTYDTTLHRHVALKMLRLGAGGASRTLREARNAAALNHPNICTIHEVGEANGSAFIAMEYVEGRSLRERLDEGPLLLDDAIRLGVEAADALACAHDHAVVHRDLKAANVIVTPAGHLKIVDFGLARRADALIAAATTMSSLIGAGVVAGTPYAMAPEQVRGEAIDARTDIWALGVLLQEMVAGFPPFEGKTAPELYSSILRDAPRPLPDDVPGDVRVAIGRCLQKAPQDRFHHASEVRAALASASGRVDLPLTSWRRRAKRGWFAAAAFAAAIAIAIGSNVFGLRTRFATGAFSNGPVTLAVLPLENQTGNPEQEYFSDGITNDVIGLLSRRPSARLRMISRAVSMPYKGSAKAVAQIGAELGAATLLKGALTRSGDRVRIVATLLDASTARSLWSETYDRPISDVFLVEHEISRAVLGAVGADAGAADLQPAPATVRPDAYDAYLRGLSHALRNNEQDIDQAIKLFEQSASLDPTFMPTQAYLALTYGNKASTYRPNEPQWEEKGFAAARKALERDPEAPEAHFAQGMMLWRPSHGFPNREALEEFRKALAAQPNFDEAWHWHGVVLFHVGHLDAAIRNIDRALEINPSNTTARFRFGPIYVYQQKFEEAIAALDRVPRDAFPAQWLYQRAWALISLGRLDEAGRLLGSALADNPADQGGVLHAARAMVRAKRGDRAGAEADIAEAIRVGRNFVHFHHTAYAIGAIYATLGDFDKAQDWIENAANDGFPNYAYFEADVHLNRLREVPRFRAFLTKLRADWEHIPGEPE